MSSFRDSWIGRESATRNHAETASHGLAASGSNRTTSTNRRPRNVRPAVTRTFGVDLASQDALTAGCVIDWDDQPAVVELRRPLSDADILELTGDGLTSVTAIDAPFGWPRPFVAALRRYDAGQAFAAEGDLWQRATDLHVREVTDRRPLSVSSDRIAYPAARAARLLTEMGRGLPLRRDGSDGVIEVYPAGAMSAWGLEPGRYKRPDASEPRARLLQAILEGVPGLDVGGHREDLVASDHALDALVAALVARAFELAQVAPIPPRLRGVASVEGWIWLPSQPLRALRAHT